VPALTFGVSTNFALANFLASRSFGNVLVALTRFRFPRGSTKNETYHSFDCKNCKTNVLKWSGVYDYSRWTPVPQASDGKASGGAARRPQPIKP
jgi:hypothetical protein